MSTRNRRSSKEKLARRHRIRRLIAFSLICGILAAIYLGGRTYYTTHFFPKTKINAVNCGNKNADDAYKMVSDFLSTYALTVHSEDGDLQVMADDVGLSYENSGELSHILEQQDSDRWFLHLNKKREFQVMKTAIDEAKVVPALEKLACMNPKNPRASTNATIVFSEDAGAFQIVEGQLGNAVNMETFSAAVKTAMLNGEKEVDLLSGAFYLPGQFTSASEAVKNAQAKANAYLKATVHYEKNSKELDLKPKRISTFVEIDPEYKVTLNKDVIHQYVEEKVADRFDTTDSLTILDTPGSGKIYVAKGNGGKAVDVADETERLLKDLKAGEAVSREPKFVTDYLYSSNAGIIKKDYVDINISKQKVYVVRDGEIAVESDCVTGNLATGRCTPTGIYRIAYKTTNHHMVKYNAFVNYWMPYDTRYGIGLHDATWRSKFGGNIFENDGSHACINLPLSKAAKIYDKVYKGIPVIVHW